MATSFTGIPSVDAISKKLAATEKQVQTAVRHAVRKTTVWAANQGRSGISDRLNIGISALKGRVLVYIRTQEGIAKSFFGLDDIPSSRLHPRQTSTGSTMDGMRGEVKHAFVAKAKNGKKFVFLRKQELNTSGPRKGKQKLEQVGLPINDAGQDVIASEVFPQVEERLLYEFERELQNMAIKS